jgi:hypothetical protein
MIGQSVWLPHLSRSKLPEIAVSGGQLGHMGDLFPPMEGVLFVFWQLKR